MHYNGIISFYYPVPTVLFGTTEVINPHQCPVVEEFHMHIVPCLLREMSWVNA